MVKHASPHAKLLGAAALIISVALLPRHLDRVYLFPGLVLLILWLICRMPVWYALRRLLVVEVFIIGIGLLSVLTPATAPLFLSAFVKSNLCALTLLLLTWTSPFHQILLVLRDLRVPPVMLTTLALLWRYLPLLADESRRMQRARASRTFSRRRFGAWRNFTAIIAQLFVRSSDRAERIFVAMCARGWKA
jgi:cobalt/nickel transport system permease protein